MFLVKYTYVLWFLNLGMGKFINHYYEIHPKGYTIDNKYMFKQECMH